MISKTTRQIMFYQLGYYTDKIDGIWGKNSKNATGKFQKDYGLKVDKIYGKKTETKLKEVYVKYMSGVMTDNDWKKLKYFEKSELDCNCGCGYNIVYKQEAYNLDAMRHYLQSAMKPTSGCRCKKKNTSEGGATNSRHYNGGKGAKACDFTSKATDSLTKRKKAINFWIKYMPNARYGYCNGYYNKQGKTGKIVSTGMGSAIHLDVK